MAGRRRTSESDDYSSRAMPAMTPEAREQQLIAASMDLAERQILEGSASSQVITHFLKLGSMREKLEQEKLQRENELLRSKIEHLESQKNVEELYKNAIEAMRSYAGYGPESTDDPVDEYYD